MALDNDFNTDKKQQPEDTYKIWRPCCAQGCFLKKQFAPEGWLCEFHEKSHPSIWFNVTQKMTKWRRLIRLADRMRGELGLDYDLKNGGTNSMEPKLNALLDRIGLPELKTRQDLEGFKRDGTRGQRPECANEIAGRIDAFLVSQILGTERFKPQILTKEQAEEQTKKSTEEIWDSIASDLQHFKRPTFPTFPGGF